MDGPDDWRTTDATPWARTVATALRTTYPYAAHHVSGGPDDTDVTPDGLHPAFHGCFDWHSSVHMQWSAIRILDLAGERLDPDARDELIRLLDERLTVARCEAEVAYLRAHPHFERPYGWAWAAQLATTARRSRTAASRGWGTSTAPLTVAVADLVRRWLPRVAYPVRSGEHANLAFALSLLHEAFAQRGDSGPDEESVPELVQSRAREWFGSDQGYPVEWEPGGSDFLSPALCEADLMRRVLPTREFDEWLDGFLPRLGTEEDSLLGLPQVRDRSDGKAVHLFGLALSRAWQLRLLAPHVALDRQRRIAEVTARRVAAVRGEIVAGDFMSTHWLVSFALLAETAAAPALG